MMKDIDHFYADQEEPIKSCLMALRSIILNYSTELDPQWKYRLPCFMYKGKMFCYLWIDKKTGFPYISIARGVKIEHPDLIQGNRKFVKLLLINPEEDIPLDTIHHIFDMAMKLHNS